MATRREFLRTMALGLSVVAAGGVAARAQEATRNTTGTMDQDSYRPVRLPAKPGAGPSMSAAERDELEHHIHCQCGCGLDVFTCRTTDFTCSVSPAMHMDVMRLVDGGYGAREILAAFQRVYGERVLMAPVKSGFNWLGYLLPFAALGGGAAVVSVLVRRWTRSAPAVAAPVAGGDAAGGVNPTDDELARLRDALRGDA